MTKLTVKSPKGTEILVDLVSQTVAMPAAGIADQPIMGWTMTQYESKTVHVIKIADGRNLIVGRDYFNAINTAKLAASQAAIEAAVPGLTALESAYKACNDYHGSFESMMADEQNDGANAPKKPAADIEALAAEYPRAALYVNAKAFDAASNDKKSAAGRRAMAIIEAGGALESAQAEMDKWTSSSYFD